MNVSLLTRTTQVYRCDGYMVVVYGDTGTWPSSSRWIIPGTHEHTGASHGDDYGLAS